MTERNTTGRMFYADGNQVVFTGVKPAQRLTISEARALNDRLREAKGLTAFFVGLAAADLPDAIREAEANDGA